jgi:hypothetical protein
MGFKKLFRSEELWVILIFVIVLAVRLIIAFQTPYFNYEAYYELRQIDSIKSTGFPLYNDPLSYGGKTQLFAPVNYYMLALFSFILPTDIVAKILPNIYATLILVIIYFLALKITKNPKIAMLTSFMAGFIPVMFLNINRVSTDYLAVLLVFSIIYCIFRINERKYIDYALILIFLLVLSTPLAMIFIPGLLLYLLLLKLENLEIEMKELEIILFFAFLVFWVNLLIYKNAFLTHGLVVIWQNIPIQLLSNYFSQLTLLETLYTISILPLILGIYAGYIVFYKEHSKEVMLLIGFAISTFLLMWFKLLNLVTALTFLSITLVVLSAFTIKKFTDLLIKTKFHKYRRLFLIIFIILFAVTAILPSVLIGVDKTIDTPSLDDIIVLEWASQNLPKTATIAATVEEGNLVTYYSHRKNIMDNNFLLTTNIDQKFKDIDTIFKTQFETEAVTILNQYKSKYIFLSEWAKKKYDIQDLVYTNNNDCFSIEYTLRNSTLYRSDCKIG